MCSKYVSIEGLWPLALPLALPADGRAALPASVDSGRVFGWPRVPSLWETAGQPVGAAEPQSGERAPGTGPAPHGLAPGPREGWAHSDLSVAQRVVCGCPLWLEGDWHFLLPCRPWLSGVLLCSLTPETGTSCPIGAPETL